MIKSSNHILTVETPKEEKFLREKTKEIDPKLLKSKDFQKEMREIIEKMRALMAHADGVGLSANQAGIPLKFFIAHAILKNGKIKTHTIFNPKITKISKTKETSDEGCLSVPNKFGPVERPLSVILEGYNLQGKKMKIKASGLLARIFQHETDHLNGILFIDKAKYVKEMDEGGKTPSI